ADDLIGCGGGGFVVYGLGGCVWVVGLPLGWQMLIAMLKFRAGVGSSWRRTVFWFDVVGGAR
ncbi:MAG: hypothetical protein ACKPKO_34995, partial [Candidatus Fonsibacter sp.]